MMQVLLVSGNLTARIKTRTKSELIFITAGINNFIETLQGIMRDVKDGSVVLSESSEEVSSQLHMADDNVTNTSAALEEISASMETVSGNVSHINSRVDDVKSAAQEIADQATDGTKTAGNIKAEADELRARVIRKKKEAGDQVERLSSTLMESVHESEKVKQINELTKVILDIASQAYNRPLHQLLIIDGSLAAYIFGAVTGTDDGGFAYLSEGYPHGYHYAVHVHTDHGAADVDTGVCHGAYVLNKNRIVKSLVANCSECASCVIGLWNSVYLLKTVFLHGGAVYYKCSV